MSNVLHLQKKKETNIVDLRSTYVVPHSRENVVDLRKQKKVRAEVQFKDKIEQVFQKAATHNVYKKESVYKTDTNYFILTLKSIAILLVVSLNTFALSSVGSTLSVLNDVEKVQDNYLAAGILDFELEVTPFSNTEWAQFGNGASTSKDVDVTPHEFSNEFVYYASTTNFTGHNGHYCEAINVRAIVDDTTVYDGPLKEMVSATTTILGAWNFEFYTDTTHKNVVCHFDIDFNGWQTRHDYPDYNNGFSDTETTSHSLYSEGLRINKVYFEKSSDWVTVTSEITDPNGGGFVSDNGNATNTKPDVELDTGTSSEEVYVEDYEWVEIYNPTGSWINIDGWKLCDDEECVTISTSDWIPPGGFALVAEDEKVFELWNVPDEFVKVTVGLIGDGLDNLNDALFLKDQNQVVIDQLNWGTPDSEWKHFDLSKLPLWEPGVTPAPEGEMLARIPTGFDTNDPSDFVTLAVPQVQILYPGDIVTEVWYWDFTYLVTWIAENINGDDEDLLIDIIMIKDTNYNEVLDADDFQYVIKSGIENDGVEEIQVPAGFLGYIWMRVVATGPENPMTHSFDTSGKIYDPFPMYMLDDEDELEVVVDAVEDQIIVSGESHFESIVPVDHPESASAGEVDAPASSDVGTTTEETASSTLSVSEETEESATSTNPVAEEDLESTTADDGGTAASGNTGTTTLETIETRTSTQEEEAAEVAEENTEEETATEDAESADTTEEVETSSETDTESSVPEDVAAPSQTNVDEESEVTTGEESTNETEDAESASADEVDAPASSDSEEEKTLDTPTEEPVKEEDDSNEESIIVDEE